jgi:PAS domain S-box-containing protein
VEPSDRLAQPRGATFAEQAVRALPDGLWTFDDDGLTTYANQALLAMLGRDGEGSGSFTVYDVLDKQGRADFARHLEARDREAGPGHDLEVCLQRLDGSMFWALVSHVPLLDDEGERRGWLYRVKDHSGQSWCAGSTSSPRPRSSPVSAAGSVTSPPGS